MKHGYKTAAPALVAALLAALFLSSCPMEAPEGGGGSEWWLDPRLVGIWRMGTGGGVLEECIVTDQSREYGNLGTLEFRGQFGGDIVYAGAFRALYSSDTSAGILIIKYWPGSENHWQYWSEAPANWAAQGFRPVGKNYYGVYYINLHADGNQVFLAQTNEQATNYGPTETETLQEAIAKFTEANLPNLLNLDVGDPQTRYTGN